MEWKKLLANIRFREREPLDPSDKRSPFEDDFSRIVFSSAFRRLQDKTQVFPLERDSLVRTRLTHSMEVANIGRSIGLSVEGVLGKRLPAELKTFIPSIVAAAGLIHDLGNPPFGHYGEDAFKNFYREKTGLTKELNLSEDQIKELQNFDGNVQTFRYLTRLQYLKDEFSYNLSWPTLATIVKYPCSAPEGNKQNGNVCLKKYGYYATEEDKFKKIWRKLGIPQNARFPLTFILEAADDIAYSANDLEDGVRKGIIDSDKVLEEMRSYIREKNIGFEDPLAMIYKKCKEIKKANEAKIENCIIEQFRIEAHGKMIKAVVEAFTEEANYKRIMAGEFNDELLNVSKARNIRKFFKSFAGREVFSHKDILKLELMGEEVIRGLLQKFFSIIGKDLSDLKNTRLKEGKLYNLISDNLRFVHEKYGKDTNYNRILLINDYISGMTDSYALQTYRKLTGIEF